MIYKKSCLYCYRLLSFYMTPIYLLIFYLMVCICLDHFNFSSTITCFGFSFNVYFVDYDIKIEINFPLTSKYHLFSFFKFNANPLQLAQLTRIVFNVFSCSQTSIWSLPVIIMLASSTWRINCTILLILGILFMYIMKSMGPSMLPCGTPY